MSSPRSQPLDPQALLILEAANELPPEDRAALDQVLAADLQASGLLEAARHDLSRLTGLFDSLDDEVSATQTEAAVAKAVSAVRDWQLRSNRLSIVPLAQPSAASKFKRSVAIGVAASILLVVGAVVWLTTLGSSGRSVAPRWTDAARLQNARDLAATSDDDENDVLALNAATSLAIGPEGTADDESSLSTGMPVTHDSLATTDQPFFDMPLVADNDQ